MESGLLEIDHYLDDFLFAGADKTSNCSKLMNTFVILVGGPSVLSSAIGTPNSEQTSVKVFINFEQLLVLSAPANKKSSR
jgi:hypothetical protein